MLASRRSCVGALKKECMHARGIRATRSPFIDAEMPAGLAEFYALRSIERYLLEIYFSDPDILQEP